jgi:outer membrane protein assembly factor BamA
MFPGKPLYNRSALQISLAGILLLCLASCSVVPKNFPKNKPFVYEYKINAEGNFTNAEKNDLETKLANQLDDSIHVRTARRFIYRGINRPVLNKPPLYDPANADRSIIFMRSLLNSLGYFKDTITYKTVTDTVNKNQYRVTVNFRVKPGKVVKLDSISYNIKQSELQSITLASLKNGYLKKGEPFSKSTISVELDRLVDLYRNNGYLRFTREELQGLWDTLDVSLLQATIDPFEQLGLLQKLKERRLNPEANLEIRLKPGFDSTKLVKYFTGNITVYPDYNQDTALYTKKEVMEDSIKVVYYRKLFKPKILPQNIYLHHGDLYMQQKYLRTINRFNSLGSWRLVNIQQVPRKDQDTVDYYIRLTPAQKYSFSANLEGSRNQSAVSGNLFGIGVNVGLQNRNFARAANQAVTNVRYGLETGKNSITRTSFIQTRQISLSHTIYFPRAIPNLRIIPEKFRDNFRTSLSLNTAITERKDLYNLNTINASWGYEFKWKKKFISLRFPNIEYSSLKSKPTLDSIFLKNPSLKNIFSDGFISSIIAGVTINGGKKKNLNLFRANVEESGLLTGLIKNNKFLDSNLYRFIKVDAEFARKIQFRKTSIAIRLFTGVGYELNSTVDPNKKNNLPFYKSYFAGGPNSMRAWGLRKLGPGSIIKDFDANGIPERYGDMQIEANFEYRFPITKISDVKINGALFTDMGNIWFLKKAAGDSAGTPEAVFNFSHLGRDLAIGAGVGLRIDFDFFVLRFDYAYKIKDPSPSVGNAALQNKWFGYKIFGKTRQTEATKFQLGISYPFIL